MDSKQNLERKKKMTTLTGHRFCVAAQSDGLTGCAEVFN